jgi:hypothetical protein
MAQGLTNPELGKATESTLGEIKTNTDNIPAVGTAAMVGSTPVTIATDDTLMLAIKVDVDKIPSKGTAAMTGSTPVTVASDDTIMLAIKTDVDKIPSKGTAIMTGSTPVTIATDDQLVILQSLLVETLQAIGTKPVLSRVVDDGIGSLSVNPWVSTTKPGVPNPTTYQLTPLALPATTNGLNIVQAVDQRWEMMQRSNLEWDAIRARMTVSADQYGQPIVQPNFLLGLDRIPWRWTMFLPAATAAGACFVTDPRGNSRYVYCMLSLTTFFRYDTWTDTYEQLLAPLAGAFAAGASLVFDADNNRVWFLSSGAVAANTWQYYDIAVNTWTTKVSTGLPTIGTDCMLAHTASVLGGNGAFIYLVGNAATGFYRYSIAANTWTTMNVVPAATGAGVGLVWDFGNDPNDIYCWRGATTPNLYRFSIIAGTWSTALVVIPNNENIASGTFYAYNPNEKRVYIRNATTGNRLKYYNTVNHTYTPYSQGPWADSTALNAKCMVYLKSPEGIQTLWMARNSGQETYQCMLGLGA